MLGKLENGQIKFAYEKVLHIDGLIIVNPREEDYLRAGYKPIEDNILENKEGYYQLPEYTDAGDKIIANYHYEELDEEAEI